MKLASRSAIESLSSANAGSNSSRGLSRAEPPWREWELAREWLLRREDLELGRRGVVGREVGVCRRGAWERARGVSWRGIWWLDMLSLVSRLLWW